MASGEINEKGRDWLDAANDMYIDEKDLLKNYRRKINKNPALVKKEQRWVNTYFTPIVEEITSLPIWACAAPETIVFGEDDRKSSNRNIPRSDTHSQAHFSSCHWTSRKAGEDEKWFDPYTEYQPKGTNQFCGIFSMMYLLDRLPPKSGDRGFMRYYIYTHAALMFCRDIINLCLRGAKKTRYLKKVECALKNSNAFINTVEFPVKID